MEYLEIFIKNLNKKNVFIFGGNVFSNLLNLNLNTLTIKPFTISQDKFRQYINKSKAKRFCPIILSVDMTDNGEYDSHANIIIIYHDKKAIELFEPHGARDNDSELESISRAYFKVSKNVHKFFKMYLPGFRYIPPNKYEAKEGLQMRLDAWSGLCVTWSILYLHYRILNPDVNPKDLINYLEKKITKSVLLRYTRYVEELLKDKV